MLMMSFFINTTSSSRQKLLRQHGAKTLCTNNGCLFPQWLRNKQQRVSFVPARKKQMRWVTIGHHWWGFTSRNSQNCCAIMGTNTHEQQNVAGPSSQGIQKQAADTCAYVVSNAVTTAQKQWGAYPTSR